MRDDADQMFAVDGLAYNSQDGFLYGTEADNGGLLKIDPSNGNIGSYWQMRDDADQMFAVDGLAYVPEPATLSLLLLSGLSLFRRRIR